MILLSDYFLKCTPLLKELHQKLFELELKHCTLQDHGRFCALPKKIIEIQGWLLLRFFIYLQNQLSNSVIVQMSEKPWS